MTGFVYKWTNTVNGRWYIGSHKGTPDDGYRHSSKIVTLAECKYGPDAFQREILFEGDYEGDKIKEKEGILLRFYDAANDPMSYNQNNIVGPNCFSKELRQKMGIVRKGKKQTADHKRKRALSMIGKNVGAQKNVKCPHCWVVGGYKTMKRWHFDNCKNKDITTGNFGLDIDTY